MFWLIRDFRLNFGGIVGAVICVAAALAIALPLLKNGQNPRPGPFFFVLAAAAGGALGNWIWNIAFPPPTNS